jgi:hypothetical protein
MKKLLVVLLMILSLLFLVLTVQAQVDVIPKIVSAECSSDGCVLKWKVILQNQTKNIVKGNVIIIMIPDKGEVIRFNMGPTSLKGNEVKEVEGTILMENSERTKSIRVLTATLTDIVQYLQTNKF